MIEVVIINLGIQRYQITHKAMRTRVSELRNGSRADLWLVEHPSVFTQGQAGNIQHILCPGAIEVVQSDRGGQVTYHGPGQVILYTLIPLKSFQLNVRQLVSLLENAVIELLRAYGLIAEVHANAPGVYIQHRKIASLGLRIRHGVSYHGVALNVSMNLSPFSRINPCGYEGLKVTQIGDFISEISIAEVAMDFAKRVKEQLLNLATHRVAG